MSASGAISGDAEFAKYDKFTRAVVGAESYQGSEFMWAEMHQED